MIYVIFIGTLINFSLSLSFGSIFKSVYQVNEFELAALAMLIIPGGVIMMYCWGKALQMITPTPYIAINPVWSFLNKNAG